MKNENEAEGGFTANEMRTDYARSHVWQGHARDLTHQRTADIVTLQDTLDLRARLTEAGDRKTADLLRHAATHITALEDKIAELRRMLREDADALKGAQRELHDARKALAEAADEIERLRAERDEVRQSYCSLMEAYRGGDGRVTANKLGWGYLFPRRPKKEDGK